MKFRNVEISRIRPADRAGHEESNLVHVLLSGDGHRRRRLIELPATESNRYSEKSKVVPTLTATGVAAAVRVGWCRGSCNVVWPRSRGVKLKVSIVM